MATRIGRTLFTALLLGVAPLTAASAGNTSTNTSNNTSTNTSSDPRSSNSSSNRSSNGSDRDGRLDDWRRDVRIDQRGPWRRTDLRQIYRMETGEFGIRIIEDDVFDHGDDD